MGVNRFIEGTVSEHIQRIKRLNIVGSIDTISDLEIAPKINKGEVYICGENGFGYAWNGVGWDSTGQITGKAGKHFTIAQVFNSVQELLSGSVPEYEYGLVAGTLSEEHPDYGKLYYQTPDTWEEVGNFRAGKGEQGSQGISAYQVWLNAGNSGTEAEFFESLKGDTGEQGIQGEEGLAGEQGEAGGKEIMIVQDEKTSGTHGGTFSNGAWRLRELNTVRTNSLSGASLVSNQIILPAGKYLFEASAPAYDVGQNRAQIVNITSGEVFNGKNTYSHTSSPSMTESSVVCVAEITEESTFQLQHRCVTSGSTTGFGLTSSVGGTDVYSQVKITKI